MTFVLQLKTAIIFRQLPLIIFPMKKELFHFANLF